MGKKRITLIGTDPEQEEKERQQKALKRQQKKLREGGKLSKAEQRAAEKQKKRGKRLAAQSVNIDHLEENRNPEADMRAEMARLRAERTGQVTINVQEQTEADKQQEGKKEATYVSPRITHPYKNSSRYQSAKSKTPSDTLATPEAVKKILDLNYTKFNGSVELHINLHKKDDFTATNLELPYAAGKPKTAVALNDEVIKKIKDQDIDFDVLFASPSQMKDLVPYAKYLGPRGLMPNPKTGTLVPDPEKAAKKFADTAIALKTENKAPIIHTTVGRTDMKPEQITENISTIINQVTPKNIKSAYLASTMSPSVRLDLSTKS